MRQKNRTIVQ